MYFITCFEHFPDENDKFLDHGDVRVFGYYDNFEECVKALNENRCNMFEGCYDYAVVEKIGSGIYAQVELKRYFKFDKEKDGFFEIETPEYMKQFFLIPMALWQCK